MSANIYTDLTREFNAGGMRAILAGGQAAVLHRIAFMSKDGDWIIREDNESTEHILNVLARLMNSCASRRKDSSPKRSPELGHDPLAR